MVYDQVVSTVFTMWDRCMLKILSENCRFFEPIVPFGIGFEGKIGICKVLFDALLACTSLGKLVMHFDMRDVFLY